MKTSTRYLIVALLALGWQPSARAQAVGQGAAVPTGSATEAGYVDLLAGLAYTDNAQLGGGQRQGDVIGTAGLDVDYARRGELSTNLLGNVDRLEYLRGTFGGSFFGHFNGSAVLGKSTDPLQWRLSDRFGEGTTDPLSAPTPTNLETVNDVSTGPIVNLHLGLANRLTLFGLYSRTSYQRSPYDSQGLEGGAEFLHQLSGASSLSIQASTERIEYLDRTAAQTFQGGTVANYDIRQASVSYQANFERTRLQLRAGYNQLAYGAGVTHGAPLFEVSISRELSPYSTVFLSGQQAYSSNGASMGAPDQQAAMQAGGSVSPGYSIAQPYNLRSGAVGWNFERARTNLSLTGTIRQSVYVQSIGTTNYNHRDEGLTAVLGRQLRPTVTVQLRAEGYVERYSRLHARTQRESVTLTLSKHFVRLAIGLFAARSHQSGAQGASNFLAASYNDDRIGVYFTYDLFGRRSGGTSLGAMPGMTGSMGGY